MTGFINARSVTKTVTTTQAWARRDSDAFILPDYIHGCAFRSHHGHTHGSISARSPPPCCVLFFVSSASERQWAQFCPAILFPFFLFGGVRVFSRFRPKPGFWSQNPVFEQNREKTRFSCRGQRSVRGGGDQGDFFRTKPALSQPPAPQRLSERACKTPTPPLLVYWG